MYQKSTVNTNRTMKYKNSRVRFRNNKPFLFKKIAVTVLVLGALVYFFIGLPLAVSIILFLFIGIPIMVKVRKQPSEGKGFFGKVKNYYKNLYKDYIIDFLPISVDIDEDKINIVLEKAEFFRGATVDEHFTIKKDKIAGILYDDIENDLLIMFETADIVARSKGVNKRHIIQQNGNVCFNIADNISILDILSENNYTVEKLSEIEDEEEETEDPELSNKTDSEKMLEVLKNNKDNSLSSILKEAKSSVRNNG